MKVDTILLKECATFSNGRAFDSQEFASDGDIHIAKIGDVTQKRDYQQWELISKNHFNSLKAHCLVHNDILMTLTGDPPDVGKVQLIYEPPKNKLSWNQRVALLRLKRQENISSSEYLFAALSSKYCRDHIERWAKGIRQRNVGNPAVLNMVIPILPEIQNHITEIIQTSFSLLKTSRESDAQAETLFLSELGLTDWQPKHRLTFIKSYFDTEQAERIDAEYYQPKYDDIVDAVKRYPEGWEKLGNLCRIKRGSLIKDSFYDQKEGNPYIRGADFSGGWLSDDKLVFINSTFRHTRETQVYVNDIVFSLIGSVGETALVTNEFTGAYISNNTGKIECKSSVFSALLQTLLTSIVGKMYFEKYKTQTAQPKISDKDLHNFIIPLFSEEKQIQIQQKIIESFHLRKQSKHLLECAKRAVELAIERDEQTAIDYLENDAQ